jgi:hypothetical protein
MRIKNYSLALVSLLALVTSSCKKSFTDVRPQQSVFTTDVFSSLGTARAAVNGLYSQMQSYSYYGRDAMVIPEVLSDNATRSVRTGNRYTGMNTMTHTATDANVGRFWDQLYRVVVNANAIIANEEKLKGIVAPLELPELTQLIGEAYAVRAMVYFDLAKFFSRPINFTAGGSHLCVPLVLKPVTTVSEVTYPPRATAKQVYDQIDLDLAAALERLPASGNVIVNGAVNASWQRIRFNRFTALALRARIAIFKSDWPVAVTAATEVINSGRYTLFTYAGIMQEFSSVGNTESILEVANNTNDNPGTDSYAYLCSQQGYGEILGTRQSMNIRSTGTTLSTFRALYEAYSATDARRQFVALGNRNSLGGEVNVPLALKYVNISTFLENTKVLRFAEMYLSRAEALARQAAVSGDQAALNNSVADLNLLRARRDTANATRPLVVSVLSAPPAGQISVSAYLDTIMLERRREFALEGQRLFDLNRTRTNYVKISSGGNATSRLIDYNATTSNFYNRTILPLPVGEVQANTNLVQNPGF